MSMRRRRFIRDMATFTALPFTGIASLAIGGCAQAPVVTSNDPRTTVTAAKAADAMVEGAPGRGANRAGYKRLLILIELKGGNDGLNTLVPYHDARYYALRPKLAIARDQVVQLSDRAGLHPALAPLLAFWNRRQLAVLQGVGYPAPNLSHFRSIEIWDTASQSDQYLPAGWLTRTFAAAPTPAAFAADGFVIGSYDLGPLDGGARVLTLGNAARYAGANMEAPAHRVAGPEALVHILSTEADIARAASRLHGDYRFATDFPASPIGNAVHTACGAVAEAKDVAVVRITQNGFDTHANQAATQGRLLGELAQALVALASGLDELHRYDDVLILTYAEFGRRPHENASAGTDHGTSSVHFALGGQVAGGLYGAPPALDNLSADGNPAHAIDFRRVYATVLERWWGVDSTTILGGRFDTLPIIRA
ncbi:MAG TPA: DUF1501 domain-containing protein [Casimicrobiaceae bacterium]